MSQAVWYLLLVSWASGSPSAIISSVHTLSLGLLGPGVPLCPVCGEGLPHLVSQGLAWPPSFPALPSAGDSQHFSRLCPSILLRELDPGWPHLCRQLSASSDPGSRPPFLGPHSHALHPPVSGHPVQSPAHSPLLSRSPLSRAGVLEGRNICYSARLLLITRPHPASPCHLLSPVIVFILAYCYPKVPGVNVCFLSPLDCKIS